MSDKRPLVSVLPRGGLGNRMIQFLVAHKIGHDYGLSLSNVCLDEWNIRIPSRISSVPSIRQDSSFHGRHDIDKKKLLALCRSSEVDQLLFQGYGQRMENFPTLEISRSLFKRPEFDTGGFDEDHLVCNIRGAEILKAIHPHYVLLPINFYRDLIRSTGLKPVFLGQLGEDAYSQSLRRAFPKAEFVPSCGVVQDFQSIRNSVNIVPAVSTFSWLAAWLSRAKNIFLPVDGLLNPRQHKEVDLLPLQDPRYRFYLFPLNYSIPVDNISIAHGPIDGMWQLVSADQFSACLSASPLLPRNLQEYLELFDESYYLKQHPDVANAVGRGMWRDGREHYLDRGFEENRSCFSMSVAAYSRRYPEAALDVSQGRYLDLRHHFVTSRKS